MKKIFTLIATAFVALSVNAQSWNFSTFKAATYTESTTVNGLKINATSSKSIEIDEYSKTVDGVTYTKRLKLGGTGSATTRSIAFDVTSPGKLKVIPCSSNATDRTLGVSVDGGDEKTVAALGSGKETVAAIVEIEKAGEIEIYSTSGNIHLYLVEFETAGKEIWDAADLDLNNLPNVTTSENSGDYFKKVPTVYPGDAPNDEQIIADATAPLTFTDYTFTVKTSSVTLKGVSTPNSPNAKGEQDAPWQQPAVNKPTQFLDTEDGPVKFKGSPIRAKAGNPVLSTVEYFFTTTSGDNAGAIAGPRYIETLWTEGCGQLPKKGPYFEVTFEKAGSFVAGVYISRGFRSTYVVEKESLKLLPQSALTFKGYNNNNTVVLEGADKAYIDYKFNDNYSISPADPNLTLQDKEVFGFLSFDVEAKTYLLFMPESQLGIYGFQFTEADPTNVEAITTKTQKNNANAALYNLAGQKVDRSYNGIVIQNGRKFVNK